MLTRLHRNDGILVSFGASLGPEDAFVGESAELSATDHTHRVVDHRTELRTAGLVILLRLLCWEGQRQREGEDCCDGEDAHSGGLGGLENGLGFRSDNEKSKAIGIKPAGSESGYL